MAQQIFISGSEIEAEPDNDSDDTNVAKGNYQSNKPGDLGVVMESTLSDQEASHSDAEISQAIINNIATDSGQSVTGSYVKNPDGSLEVTAKDSTGAVTNDVILLPDGTTFDAYYGSTKNGTSLGGGEWATTVSYPSSSGLATIETAQYDANQINVANDFINENGTSLSTKWAMNADGSQTFMSAAPLTETGTPESLSGGPQETADSLSKIIGDSVSYGVDKAIEYAKLHSTSPAVRVASGVIEKVLNTYELGKTGADVVNLSTELYDEIKNGQPISTTATQLSAKIAIGAIQAFGILTEQPAVTSLAERFVTTGVAGANLAIGAFIDAGFELKDRLNGIQVSKITDHPAPTPPPGTTPTPMGALQAATTAPTLTQRTIYEWAGLDTAGFAGSQFPGAGVQDLTANQTKVVIASLTGTSFSFSDTSNHNLRVTVSEKGLSSTTGTGNDTFVVAAPNQTIDGGGGSNAVVLSGNKADYRVSAGAGKVVVIDKNGNRDGYDLLTNVQTLTFADGNMAASAAPITATNTIGVFRFFDTKTGTHFFSSSASEVSGLQASRPDLTYEGAGFQSQDSTNKDPNDAPVYRFFDTVFGTHFYTASLSEKNTVQSTRADLKFEGTGFYEHVTAQGGDDPVYRFFDTVHGTHFYTDNAGERATIISTRADLKDEGIGFYAPSYKFG